MVLALLLAAVAAEGAPPKKGVVETQRKHVVDAIRNCAVAGPGEIAVCARDRGVAEGFRIPRLDPRFAGTLRKSGRGEIAESAAIAAGGVGSCSATGAGGFTGCTLQDYKNWGIDKQARQAAGERSPW